MRISSKITAGYAILITLMAGAIAFEVFALHRIQAISLNLSQVNFRARLATLQLMRDRDLVDEYCRKYFTNGDADFVPVVEQRQKEFETTLADVRRDGRSKTEQAEVERLEDQWNAFKVEFRQEQKNLPPRGHDEFPSSLENRLTQLRQQIYVIYDATLLAIEAEFDRSNKTGNRAETVAWIVACIALAASGIVLLLITHSIAKRLRHLTEGTRRIADGQFGYRLQTSGNDEFTQLGRDFNSMTQQLGELDQMKKDFVSHVSHELKAPLASIRETHQLLLEELPGPLTARQKKLLEINLHCARRLGSMIGNLLDLSRMEAGMMEYELKNCDISALIRTSLEEHDPQAAEKNLTLEAIIPDAPLLALCDYERCLQVLGNLLSNAIKFSTEKGRIQIRAQKVTGIPPSAPSAWRRPDDKREDRFILIQVVDNGPGVPAAMREKIFEKFRQVRQTKALKGQGVGLGLAICRTIVVAHQGAIWVENNPGGGSVFAVLLPVGSENPMLHPVSAPL
jgi:signal transduction histidine kinase